MGYPTPIEWTDATWNPIGGCTIKSPGCAPCYAQQLAGTRLKTHPLYEGTTTIVKGKPVFNGHLTALPDDHPGWRWPIGWRGATSPKLGAGKPSLIFVGDMSDLYHERRPRKTQDKVLTSIVHSRHIGQLLTKRPDVMRDHIADLKATERWRLLDHPYFGKPNFADNATFERDIVPRLWVGMSAERQQEFDERWPHLRKLAHLGFTVFLSYEPAIGPLTLPKDFLALGRRAQVIFGGMSGEEARPPYPCWARSVRDQCAAAGVAFLMKQWGEFRVACEIADSEDVEETAWRRLLADQTLFRVDGPGWEVAFMRRVGKKAAGRLLDGVEHNEFPEVAA